MKDFEGDVLFTDSPDGGQISIENGLIACDKGFATAVYISLFGGNEEDSGLVKNNKGFWGNCLGEKDTQLVSKFQHFIKTCPLTPKNLIAACDAAKSDLEWMIKDEIATDIEVTGRILSFIEADFHIVISNGNENILDTNYGVNWEANNGISE